MRIIYGFNAKEYFSLALDFNTCMRDRERYCNEKGDWPVFRTTSAPTESLGIHYIVSLLSKCPSISNSWDD